MYCQTCGKQIADGSVYCPECGASQGIQQPQKPAGATGQPSISSVSSSQTTPKKKKTALWIILGIVVVIIIATAIGGKSGSKTDAGTATGTDSTVSAGTAASNAPAATAGDKIYAVGEAAVIDGCNMVVNSVTKSSGAEYETPKSGNEYVIVNITISNSGKNNLDYNPFYYKMQNSQGQITDMAITFFNQDSELSSGELAPGGSVTGSIVFEQPINDPGLVLQYQDNVFADGTKLQFKCS